MEENPTWLEISLQKQCEENSIAKVLNVEISDGTKKGDNYMSVIKRIKMDILLKSGRQIKKSLIMKTLPLTEFHQAALKDMALFGREITMYRDVTPKMEDILIEFADYTEPMWGKMLDFKPYDKIYFEDLTQNGYMMANRRQGLDFDHCLLVMRSLAKFHAMSAILVERGLLPMNIYRDHVFKNAGPEKMMQEYYKQSLKKLTDIMESQWEPEWLPMVEKLRTKLLPRVAETVLGIMDYNEEQFNVLNHGDCWVNNMMFKYGLDSATPISLKFVDLQMCYYSSPAYDLQYFLSTSLNLDVRKNHIEKLLKTYHETLVKQLELCLYKGNVITFDQLIIDLQKRDIFGLMTAVTLMPYVYREENSDNFPEFEELIKDMKQDEKLVIPDCKNPMYYTVLKDIITKSDNNKSI